MLALHPEFDRARHAVDLFAHLGEGGNDALPLRLGILRHRMLDMNTRLVEHRMPPRHAHDQLQALQHDRARILHARIRRAIIGQFSIGDQF